MPALNTLRYGVFVLVAAMIFAFSNVRAEPQPLRLAITDLEGLEQLQREFGAFRDLLVEKTGLDIDFFPSPNRTAAVEAMRAKKLELALTGPAEYVVFKSRTDARPVLGFSRPDYFASLVVTAQSGINSVRDLRGKTVALGPIGSTSKHLAPMQILKDNGLIPGVDVKLTHTGAHCLPRNESPSSCSSATSNSL